MICTVLQDLTADETVAAVNTNSTKLVALHVVNGDDAVRYLQLFNAATGDVDLGTTVPTAAIPIKASSDGPTHVELHGLLFSTACSYAITTTATGSTGPTADAHLLILHA